MKNALILAAVGEGATGLALLIVPSLVGQLLLGEPLAGVAIPVARVSGIALIDLLFVYTQDAVSIILIAASPDGFAVLVMAVTADSDLKWGLQQRAFKMSGALFRSATADGTGRRMDAQGRRQDLKTPVEQALMRGLGTA